MNANWTPLPNLGYNGVPGQRCVTDVGMYEVHSGVTAWGGMGWCWSLSMSILDVPYQKSAVFSTREQATIDAEADWLERHIEKMTTTAPGLNTEPVIEPEEQIDPKAKQRQNFSELVSILTGAGG